MKHITFTPENVCSMQIDFDIDEAKTQLKGITLESLVVAERVAKAVKVKAAQGLLDTDEFPLLMHIDEIITQGAAVNIPWEKFTFEG